MRAAVYDQLGPAAEVLRVIEIDPPEPAAGEVRVKVLFSGVNPTDWKMRSAGAERTMPFAFQVPNQDGAGLIEAVGPGVDPARIGQRVWLYFTAYQRQFGSAEEFVCVPERLAVALPERASLELGASLGVPALTAHHALFGDGPIAGQTVLVAGGAGAVGHFAIELAHWRGARVITTVSSAEKAALAQSAGADLIINYKEQDVAAVIRAAAPQGVDRIVEVAPENFLLDLDVLAPRSAITFYASTASEPVVPVRRLMTANVTLHFMLLYTIGQAALEQAITDVNVAIEDGALSELPIVRFPLGEIVAAHQAVEEGRPGKVLLEL